MKTINYRRIIDLTHKIDPDIPLWPGDPVVELETIADFSTSGYYLRRFSMGEHSGTHLNSPKSFYQDGMGIDDYSPESCILSAVVINIREKASQNPDAILTVNDIKDWEEQHDIIPANSMILLYTGWQEKWHNPIDFLNIDTEGKLHFPGFGNEATQFLIEQRHIMGVGIDTHGVDPGFDHSFNTNKIILKNNGFVLENLTNLDQLPATKITLIIGILKLTGGSGSPVSVLALI
ncbi:cyclase family protein [Planktothrix agardhii]|jgi:Predicted metal-dependent hydrolase|uniref:cyclase family protein n=1 Tax=Planktothrix agardhii TaxID=1160 RepID=UPI000DBB98CB|nr:cyclase family protein [Planktothrix agardhii]BBD56342.1 putative cyclase [Planktothrix agardhii NIES-204]MCB8778556.1 cyclase family protein [Planktothrix agardhii 1031]MCB8788695.1 cyclase family protein [Planktothrix agardhii 1025]MCF3597951.1 cyclase family protein [Planktothrix agardhii 1032]MCF3613496.1 cyclase family protein [Planktothrix agardhii 1027]